MSAANSDNFIKTRRTFSTQIGSGGVADGVTTTIPLASATNLPTDTAVCLTINRVDSNGNVTNNTETVVGVVSGTNLINCTRGVEGTAQAWGAGKVVELLWCETNVNRMVTALLLAHEQSGRIKTESYYAADTGSANAYLVAPSPAFTAYNTGMVVRFKATNANTGASTININSLGVKTIRKGGGASDLDANDIRAGSMVTLIYDGTYFQILSATAHLGAIFAKGFSNYVVSGLTVPTSASLTTTIAAGVVMYNGIEYDIATDNGHAYTASNDCYVDVNPATGAFAYNTVSNGAAAPALTASSIRIAKVVTNGTTVSAVYQDESLDSIGNVIYPSNPKTQGVKHYTPSSGGTVTLDFSNYAKRHIIQMPAGNITIALPSGVIPSPFIIEIIQDSVGSRTVTWFTTIDWTPNGSAPTLTTTANKKDTFGFLSRVTGTYDGYVIGQGA